MKLLYCICVAVLTTAVFSSGVLGYDTNAPSWRGGTGTTCQMWEFAFGSSGTIAADASSNPYGAPVINNGWVTYAGTSFSGYHTALMYNSSSGAGNPSTAVIPCATPAPGDSNELWLQVAYLKTDGWANELVRPDLAVSPGASLLGESDSLLANVYGMGPDILPMKVGEWRMWWTDWQLQSGASVGNVALTLTHAAVDSVVADTRPRTPDVPEWSSLGLALICGLPVATGLRLRRRTR